MKSLVLRIGLLTCSLATVSLCAHEHQPETGILSKQIGLLVMQQRNNLIEAFNELATLRNQLHKTPLHLLIPEEFHQEMPSTCSKESVDSLLTFIRSIEAFNEAGLIQKLNTETYYVALVRPQLRASNIQEGVLPPSLQAFICIKALQAHLAQNNQL